MWLVVAPFGAGGVLVAHTLAYRLTSAPDEGVHGYLDHAPQVLALVAVAALSFSALTRRVEQTSIWPFPVAGVAAFVLQEHLERLVHSGHVPWLLTTPAFLVGLVLQVPAAALAVLVARWLLQAVAGVVSALPPPVRHLLLAVHAPVPRLVGPCVLPPGPARGPPALESV